MAPASAATYVFPGSMPAGCSGSNGNYRCAPLTLGNGDSIRIGSPTLATVTINGALTTNNASINASGSASNLTLVVTGALTVSSGAKLVANVTAGSLADADGGVVFDGDVKTSGIIELGGDSTVSGNLSSSAGAITLGSSNVDRVNVVGNISSGDGAITLGIGNRVGGNLSSTNGAIGVAYNASVGGTITSTTGAIGVGYNSSVGGTITSTTGAIGVGYNGSVGGAITSTTGAIGVGYNSSVGGAITSTTGAIGVGYNTVVSGTLTSTSGAISIGYSARVTGAVTSGSGPITLGYLSVVSACVKSSESAAITLGDGAVANGVCCGASNCSSACVDNSSNRPMPALCSAASSLHHLELRHGNGAGLTCAPSTLTLMACQDAACTTPYTAGVTGTLVASGSGMSVNWPGGAGFGIAAGNSSTSAAFQVTSVGSVVLGTTTTTPAPGNPTRCNFGSPSCTFSAADSGFVFDVANHASELAQTVSVSALRKPDGAALCVPAFASVSKSVTFGCAYQNPASGTLPVRVGSRALNAANSGAQACDAGGAPVSLAFNAGGVASTTVQYADVGQLQLTARYTGSGNEAGLVMTGSDSFIAAPASFGFGAVTGNTTPAGTFTAGRAFAATVTARNANAATTPNFGRETAPEAATLAFTRAQPSGTGASNGAFSGGLGAFTAGVASASNLVWSEVGRGDVGATLASGNYLGSGLAASGTTGSAGAVGRFIPHHFDVVVAPACGSFSYAAQPFSVTVTAKNGLASPGTTVNYDGSGATTPNFARALSLSDAPALGVGSFGSSGVVAPNAFSAGVAALTPVYSFSAKLTPAKTLVVRALDADAVSSSGHAEGSTVLRSGRLRLSNAFGSEKTALRLSVQAQYWSGNAWVPNSADACSALPAAAVVFSGTLDHKGAPTAAWSTSASAVTVSGGQGTLILSAPSPGATGSIDLALNLGTSATDQSCLSAHPASTGAALPWLRAQHGNCSAAWDRDPAARASFGIYAPETRKTLHVREVF